jgi:acyl carrier protein
MDIVTKKLMKVFSRMRVSRNFIKKETRYIKDLGFDSIDILDFVAKLELEFHINIKDEDIKRFDTVGSTLRYLKARVETNVGY